MSQCCKTNNVWVIVINVNILKIKKWTTKNQKFENPSMTHKTMLIWVQGILLLEIWDMGGYKLKVQGTNSYPVNDCIYVPGCTVL